jgi:hypothetical protein
MARSTAVPVTYRSFGLIVSEGFASMQNLSYPGPFVIPPFAPTQNKLVAFGLTLLFCVGTKHAPE